MVVIAKTSVVISRLAELGLTVPILRDAVLAGELERISSTEHHPKSRGGWVAWSDAVGRLRESLAPAGWIRKEPSNLPMIIDPIRKVGIVVSSGNRWTGHEDHDPTTKYPKGDVFKVKVVGKQLRLFGDDRSFAPTPPMHEIETWLLLIYPERLPKNDMVARHIARCELSLPCGMDEKGYVTHWTERIILEPVTMDDVPLRRGDSSAEDEGKIEVPVARR